MTPTEHLHRLHYHHHRTTYPSVPATALPKPDYKLTDTNGLTRAIIDFIRFTGNHAERVNTMGRQIKAKNGKQIWITTTATKGSADIHAVIRGRSAMIEVKNARTHDRIRPKQEEYARRVTMAGGLYFVARTFEEFYEWYADANKVVNTIGI